MSQVAYDWTQRRRGERRQVTVVAELRTLHRLFRRTHEVTRSVTINNISGTGACFVMPYDSRIEAGHVCDLAVDGAWSGVRVIWTERGLSGTLLCGVEFIEPCSPALAALYR